MEKLSLIEVCLLLLIMGKLNINTLFLPLKTMVSFKKLKWEKLVDLYRFASISFCFSSRDQRMGRNNMK